MRFLRLPSAALLVLAWLGAGCNRDRAAEPGVTRADSAGIRLITSTARDTVLGWTFTEIDVLRDTLGDPFLFTAVSGRMVVTDRAGRTYVLTDDRSVIRFGRDGRAERTLGRRGGGPGEMQMPTQIGAMGDTLFALDLMKGAFVRWAPTLEPLADRRLEGAFDRVEAVAFRTGGLWLERRIYGDTVAREVFLADTLGQPLHEVSTRTRGIVRLGRFALFGKPPLFSPAITWSASGPRVVVNAGPGYDVWLYEGPRPIAILRRPVALRAPTVDDVRTLYPEGFRLASGGTGAVFSAPLDEVMKGFGVAPVFPAVHDLALFPDGTIWVQRTPRGASAPGLDVFGPNGAYVGTVQGMSLPVGLLPNGDLLVPRTDEPTGGMVVARVRVWR